MRFEDVHSLVGDIPFIGEKRARYLYDQILWRGYENILELGIAHGTATCYMAAALDELGRGTITAVDLIEALDEFDPCAEDLVEKCGLGEYVSIHRMKTGYNWFLHNKIAEQTTDNVCKECYDLCIIDGPKNWTIDGAAFFMVDKLLKRNGAIIFDDYNWSYADADNRRDATDGITHRSLSDDEMRLPHIKEIVDLLVTPHPNYGRITMLDDSDWVIADKTKSPATSVEFKRTLSLEQILVRLLVKLRNDNAVATR